MGLFSHNYRLAHASGRSGPGSKENPGPGHGRERQGSEGRQGRQEGAVVTLGQSGAAAVPPASPPGSRGLTFLASVSLSVNWG